MSHVENKCLFCRISTKSLPATIAYEDDLCLAFHDIHPKAPTHILIIPKQHIRSLAEINQKHELLIGHLFTVLKQLAEEQGLADLGYRTIINTRHHGGQEVDHLHVHLLGGEPLGPMRA